MLPSTTLTGLILTWLGLALVAFAVLWFVDAPYGRRARPGWGPGIPNRFAWFVMGVAPMVAFLGTVWATGVSPSRPTWAMIGLFTAHYIQRGIIYPWRTRTQGKTTPLLVVLGSIVLITISSVLLAADLLRLNRGDEWFTDPRLLVGVVVFLVGAALNQHSDNILLRLRAPGETGYKIPRGGAFRWVSSPNLLGEMIEWIGFAMLTFSLGAVAFAAWTCANLIPRARSNHRWYLERFPDYPKERRALLPGLW